MDEASSGITTLLGRWAQSNTAARDRVIELSFERLHYLCQSLVRQNPRITRWESVEDILQESIPRLIRSVESVQPENSIHFFRLSATVMRRVLLDMIRTHLGPQGFGKNHDHAGFAPDTETQYGLNAPCSNPRPDHMAEIAEMHLAIENLSDEHQSIFDLIYYCGLTQIETAEALGVSVRTVRRRWREARLSLADQLKKFEVM